MLCGMLTSIQRASPLQQGRQSTGTHEVCLTLNCSFYLVPGNEELCLETCKLQVPE